MKAPSSAREKILCFGPPKVGKSTAAASIPLLHHKMNTDITTWWLDTDGAADDMASVLDTIPNLKLYKSYGDPDTAIEWWEELRAYGKEIAVKAQPGDWVIFDKADSAWTIAAQWYDQQKWEKTQSEIRLDQKKAGKTGWAMMTHSDDDRSKWAIIKPEYLRLMQPLVLKCKAHMFFICEEKETQDNDEKARRLMFQKWAPAGNKGLPYQVRTAVRLDYSAQGRTFTTWERLGRESIEKKPYTVEQGFGMAYLCGVAGWKLK